MFNIKGTVKGYIFDCCERYAKAKGISIDSVQLIMSLDVKLKGEDIVGVDNTYFLCENYEKKEQYTFLQVIDVTIDFFGKQMLAEPFIRKSLVRLAQTHEIDIQKVNVLCSPFLNSVLGEMCSPFLN